MNSSQKKTKEKGPYSGKVRLTIPRSSRSVAGLLCVDLIHCQGIFCRHALGRERMYRRGLHYQ